MVFIPQTVTTGGSFQWYPEGSGALSKLRLLVEQSGVKFGRRYNWVELLLRILQEKPQHPPSPVPDQPVDTLCHDRYTHKVQKSIRRLWHSDILLAWPDTQTYYISLFTLGYDTSTCNTLILTNRLYKSPILGLVITYNIHAQHFVEVFSVLSDKVKAAGLHNTTEDVFWVPEAKNSGGHTYDYVDAEVLEQVVSLTKGGLALPTADIPLYTDRQAFISALDFVTSVASPRSSGFNMTFEEYVKSFVWDTTGASSFGRVVIDFKGETYDVKARKNMLKFSYTPEQIWEHVAASKRQVNKCFIKHELGKARVAVTSDLASYLRQSYVSEIIGSTYLDWAFFTLEETNQQLISRVNESFKYPYFVPYDYKSFDLQPSGTDISDMVDVIISWAKKCCPTHLILELDKIAIDIKYGFAHADLISNIPGAEHKGVIRGGISSGLRWTSLIGNLYNSARMRMAQRLAQTESTVKLYVRGDDTVMMSASLVALDRTLAALDVIGAIPNTSKFSVQQGAFEFLRTWYTPKYVRGYPTRSAIAMLQRKPWANAPVSRHLECTTIIEAHYTTLRRCNLSHLVVQSDFVLLMRAWCRNVGISTTILTYPFQKGGVALIPTNYSDATDMSSRLAALKLSSAATLQTNFPDTAGALVFKEAIDFCERDNLSYAVNAAKISVRLIDVLELDAVPQLAALYKANDVWRHTKPKGTKGRQNEYVPAQYGRIQFWSACKPSSDMAKPASLFFTTNKFGQFAKDSYLLSLLGDVALLTSTPVATLRNYYLPDYQYSVNKLSSKGMHRTVIDDWLIAKASRYLILPCHSAFAQYIGNAVMLYIDSLLQASLRMPPGLLIYMSQVFTLECCALLQLDPVSRYFMY